MTVSPDATVKPAGNEPRDAATLVIVDEELGQRRVLLGKRRQTQVFAPGKFVFPGGSVDPGDCGLALGGLLRECERHPLMHDIKPASGAITPEVFALAAIRETFEETGLLVGSSHASPTTQVPPGWQSFVAHGFAPQLSSLAFIARAITPPGRSRRFDARFFLVPASAIALQTQATDGEFEELAWVTFSKARAMDLHNMTLSVLNEAERFLLLAPEQRACAPVPYFLEGADGWRRNVIARQPSALGA